MTIGTTALSKNLAKISPPKSPMELAGLKVCVSYTKCLVWKYIITTGTKINICPETHWFLIQDYFSAAKI